MLARYTRIAGILLLFLAVSCTRNHQQSKSMEQIYAEEGVPVSVEVVQPRSFSLEYTFPATLSGIRESSASAMIADKVDEIRYKVGDRVKKDDVVMTFPTDNPGAKYYQTKVAYDLAKTTLDRMTNLYNGGGISLQEYDNTKTQYEVSKANWDAVQQTVMVKAPISGVISQINVQETDNVSSGDALFTVSETQKLKAKMWATEDQVGNIRVGDKVTAQWQNKELTGRVTQVDMSLNTSMQAFGVVVELDNPDSQVMSGVNVQVTIHSGSDAKTIVLERKNVLQENENDYVYVEENGVAKKRQVQVGKSQGLEIQIVSGLNSGDRLITGGQMLLSDGEKIRVVKGS